VIEVFGVVVKGEHQAARRNAQNVIERGERGEEADMKKRGAARDERWRACIGGGGVHAVSSLTFKDKANDKDKDKVKDEGRVKSKSKAESKDAGRD
jgi:hypothetical protein